MGRAAYRRTRRKRIVPQYILAERFKVTPRTINNWGREFNYNPYDVESFIGFLEWIFKNKLGY